MADMYEKYIREWKHYQTKYGPQTALFYMVGKFYELYDILDKETHEGQTTVRQAVELLGITLTVREKDGPQGQDCLFAGFPEQSLQKFAGMLTRQGWTVVTCNQAKNDRGTVTDRPVFRIFSPGTHIETAGAESPYLAGLWLQEREGQAPDYAATVLDLTTGHLVSFSSETQGTPETWSADDLVHFFQVHPPRELVVWWRGAALAQPSEAALRRRVGYPKGALHVESGTSEAVGALEIAAVRQRFLERLFRQGLLPLYEEYNLRDQPLIERSLVHILRFAEDHVAEALRNLKEHSIWHPEYSVYLGNNSLVQLNYLPNGQETSVLLLFERTLTSLGRRALRDRLLIPSADPDLIRQRLREVSWFSMLGRDPAVYKSVQSWLRMIQDLARLHRKLSLYTVDATDVLAMDQSYGAAETLSVLLNDSPFRLSDEQKAAFQEAVATFRSHFDLQKARQSLSNPDISFLPDAKAPKTTAIEAKLAEKKREAEQIVAKVHAWAGLPPDTLRLEVTDTKAYTLTGTKAVLDVVSKKLAQSGATKPYENMSVQTKKSSRGCVHVGALEDVEGRVYFLRFDLEAAVRQELPALCQAVQAPFWSFLESWIALVDVSLTLAKVAKERGYVCPEIVDGEEGGLQIFGLRHPLLEIVQTRVEYVKHTVQLGFGADEDQGWLLYGMNASGKSSLMKAVGIAVLLAQAGSFVPAKHMRLRPFQSLLTRIWNQDNLWAGLSSFAVEVAELRDIFNRADGRSLVLGDELCSGTESVSATSLVAAGIQYLHERKSRFIFATHLHGLVHLEDIRALPKLGIWHLKVHYDPATDILVYDRTLHKGPGGTLYGLEVARAMHLPYAILKQAHVYRKRLLGEAHEEDAPTSAWNTSVARRVCELCGSAQVRDLEVHHIRPRAEAGGSHVFEDGLAVHHERNLVVLCQRCHDEHHAGRLEVAPLQQTSEGPQRPATVPPSEIQSVVSAAATTTSSRASKKWTDEQVEQIEAYLRKNPHGTMKRAVYDLKLDGIEISESSLRKFRSVL